MPELSSILERKFPHEPTDGQVDFFKKMDDFIKTDAKSVFLLKGYAGTGKTSIVTALVNALPLVNYKFMLMAPTGRAAKVMSQYTSRSAFTIHKIIYKQVADGSSGQLKFKLQKSYYKKCIFVIDESSMLSSKSDFGTSSLLKDVLTYAFSNDDNKVIFIGDTAQLPPVGQSESMGLKNEFFKNLGYDVNQVELTEVMRQELESGILFNATRLRNVLKTKNEISFMTKSFDDIYRMKGERMEEGLRYCYDKYGIGETIIICRSNKSAVQYNQYIRRQIHFTENELDVGDIIMAVRNNYFYTPEGTPSGFIANGDFFEVMKIYGIEEMYGHRFADLELRFYGMGGQGFEVRVMLDTLYSDTPSMSQEDNANLYRQVSEDYADLSSVKARREALKSDAYLNALQIKFAYALTCHKSQGGQWSAVFIDQGFIKEEQKDEDFTRWLYTAVTRATDELFLLNFKPGQFQD